MPDFDLAIIGAGAAGLSVAAGAAQLGASVALIERDRWAATASTPDASPARRCWRHPMPCGGSDRPPASASSPPIRPPTGIACAPMCTASSPPSPRWIPRLGFAPLAPPCCAARRGFVDPTTISVDGRAITARRFVIAAGSRATVPPIEGLDRTPYWTNDSLFDLAERPDHLLILGGGPIGLEMADAFSGLGCGVTVIEAGRIAAKEDPELAAGLRQALIARGVTFREGVTVTSCRCRVRRCCSRTAHASRGRICWSRPDGHRIWRRSTCRPPMSRPARPASPPTAACAASATSASSRWATSPTRSGSARARSPMSGLITPASSFAACCSAFRPGSTTPRCRASPIPIRNWRRPA